eukprot:g28925.t1
MESCCVAWRSESFLVDHKRRCKQTPAPLRWSYRLRPRWGSSTNWHFFLRVEAMQIKVFYSADASKSALLDVQPSDTVKAVKQKIIALHSPPERDHALFYPEFQAPRSADYLENKKRLAQCGIEDGASLKFAYARNLTLMEKVELSCQGVKMDAYQLPAMSISTLPPQFSA